ncbi:hypothetical protein EPD60_08940 [Flaviaesturariibacter flavus]|uniref:Uncharacterized protein n=1 Tax=Flaviaesturariibacter flavus TaxID=2502780 RepID=A0A4R1BAX1_9BACT|nr:hypothetical protein [Flaviaesturariibacter flavus]TCJ14125.1 hypothetical protein EPD60_08940 [Flaviaesturariibacter flavus]
MNAHRLPALLFGIAALLLLGLLLWAPQAGLDLHVADTYLVIEKPFLYAAPAALCFLFCLLYLVAGRILLSRWLSWIHLGLTLAFFAGIFYTAHSGPSGGTTVNLQPRLWTGTPFELLLAGFAIGQAVFVLNLLGGLLRAPFRRRA